MSKNAIECAYCGAIIESTFRHDFQQHSCEKMRAERGEDYFIAADGGNDYWRRCGTAGRDYKELGEE